MMYLIPLKFKDAMRPFLIISYNLIIYPFTFILVLLLSFFNVKIRKSVLGRFNSLTKIKKYFKSKKTTEVYWFHVSSLGEFYQTKSIIELLKINKPDITIVLSFFSPSGFEKSYSSSVDLSFYIPFDFPWIVSAALQIINPKKVIICSNDIWPNLIWIAKKKNINTSVFSFYMKRRSGLFKNIRKIIFRILYNDISSIYTVTIKDKTLLLDLLNDKNNTKIEVCGNPRYDTIFKDNTQNIVSKNIPILKRQKRIIIGSSHAEDDFTIPIIISIIDEYPDAKVLYAPHEPNKKEINRLINIFSDYKKTPDVLYDESLNDKKNSSILILGTVGILAELYWHSQIVYIGGGFSKGIHNIMEPSITGVPILFGPNYEHADEAEILIKNGGAICIKNEVEFKQALLNLLDSPKYLEKVGKISSNLIKSKIGASSKIVGHIITD